MMNTNDRYSVFNILAFVKFFKFHGLLKYLFYELAITLVIECVFYMVTFMVAL